MSKCEFAEDKLPLERQVERWQRWHKDNIKSRLEYFRREINAERISLSEILELQSLAEHIQEDDVRLLEWAGVPESHSKSS